VNWLKSLFSSIGRFFSSDKGKQTISIIEKLVQIAIPIVLAIAKATGNSGAAASISSVQNVYETYGVPLTQTLVDGDKAAIGNALQNLAVVVLQKQLPPDAASVATNVLNTAVSLAYTATKVS